MEASVTRQSGQLPLRQVQFMTLRETRRGRRLPRDTAIIALLSLVYSATVQPLITAFMLTSDIQTFATISLLTMHVFRCFSIMSPFKLAALPLMFTVAIVQMGSMLYLHSIFILFSFILSGILHGSLKTIFQAYTVHLAKRNIFARPNFIYDSNRLFMFFGIAKALELIGNALGFFIIAGTYPADSSIKFETPCGTEFCFFTHGDNLISSVSSLSNFFTIYERKFIPVSTQFILYSLLCIGVFASTMPLRSIHSAFIDTAADQSPIDVLSKTAFNDLFPLGMASGYLDVFIFYEISNSVIYCVMCNMGNVCTVITCVLLFTVISIIFIATIITNSVKVDTLPVFCAALTGTGCMAVLWLWHPVQGDQPMLYIILFSSSVTSLVFTLISYRGVLERHGGDNGVMSIEFCRELGGAIAFLVRLHPCMREKVIAASVIICASISPFLFKQLIKKRSAAQQHLSSVSL
ncbi:hypothetical protein Tcan_01364 [Toxocara canis]|uniref:Transmembrane protein n=1 Tax=Toxocara canis TaxID=6265 RepID=A0A0B2V9P6_TOXCA|nr:hypothetical protein Tcan_01364 [Toxocara canis]